MKSLLNLALVGWSQWGALAATPGERAQEILDQMTLSEKIAMMHGQVAGAYVGNIVGNDRLGIPSINMQDGPQGFRVTATTGEVGSTTAWPSALSAAASWDTDLLYRWASAMGEEFRGKGANVQLAPGIGIARVPQAGRNFEYLCGEDPYFGSIAVRPVVKGIQDQGVIANAKHWINNEIEEQRMTVSSNVDERTRFELYYPPFEAAIEAGVLSAMCSYNRINDQWGCQNNETIAHLKKSLGFDGWLMSDWTATHSTATAMNAGLDQEMPEGLFYSEKRITEALDDGSVVESSINDSVLRMLTSMFSIGLFDTENTGSPDAVVTSEEHSALAREIAAKSAVLVQNENNMLPFAKEGIRSVLVVGDQETVSGGGSGHVEGAYLVTASQGIADALVGSNAVVTYYDGSDLSEVTALAKSADVVVVLVATTSCEGNDRDNLSLGEHQDSLVTTVAAANSQVVVNVYTPGAVLMPWKREVNSILVSWLPGQEAGNALADVLFGSVNPSARLHVTMPNFDNEVQFSKEQYPGVGEPREASYTEELLIGYRYYDAMNIEPNFCFGHGLSYTTFEYSSLAITIKDDSDDIMVSVTVHNTGSRDGDEVAQLYLSFPVAAGEPPRQLKGFQKIHLIANEETRVNFNLSSRDRSIWNSAQHAWEVVDGAFGVYVGASSRDIRVQSTFGIGH